MKKLLTDFICKYIWRYIIGIMLVISTSLLALIIPKLIGMIMDGLNTRTLQLSGLIKYTLLIVAVSIVIFLVKFLWRYLIIGNCRKVEVYLRGKLFRHLQTLSVDFFNTYKTGDLMAYAINDIQAIRMVFGGGIVQSLDIIVTSVFSIFFMSNMVNPALTAIVLMPIPLTVIIVYYIRKQIRQRFKRVQEAFADISDKTQENISGIRVIKAFSQEEEEVKNFKKFSRARIDAQMNLTKLAASLGPIIKICFGLSLIAFIIYGSQLVIDNKISIGDFVAYNSYILIIMNPVIKVTRIIEIWQRAAASYKRLDEIFKIKPDIENNNTQEGMPVSIKGNIRIRNLSFSYPNSSKKVLKNINLEIGQGKTLGILGRSGSGKTTLVNLLLRLYKVDDGHIFIDNEDINHIPVDILRESIGYVPQDSFLFSTTIKENIEFFRPVYSDDDIENAAKLSDIYDNIMDFPRGFDTMVGEYGTTLSGGQKQRISIARAIVKDPSILILDDCLSAVDTETENKILQNFKKILKNRTGIIISHRISTIKNADEIIFLENGKVIERGSHDELMSKKGNYYNLYLAQSASIEGEAEGGVSV